MGETDNVKPLVQEIVRRIPVFRNVSDERLEQLVEGFTIREAQKGEVVFYQTDKSSELYIILRGKVKVTLMSEGGEEFILTDLKEGDFFGELSLIDGNPRSASIEAESDSTFAVLKRSRLLNAIRSDPDFAIDLLSSVVQRLRESTEREESLAFLAVRERLILLFSKLIKEEGKKAQKGYFRIRRRTHKEIAERIGSSRESISKVIKKLILQKLMQEEDDVLLLAPDLFEDHDVFIT